MRIRRIRIEEFRKLRGPLCVDGLGEGLTVIAGDNEEGKSTVLEAIRAALFCRHRANDDYVRTLAPFNCDGARPRVELDFAINGSAYRLNKAFCRKPHEALLMVDGKSFQGDAAEEELCRILGLAAARKGATKPEDQGVWGLFWVSQATAFDAAARVGDGARATLSGALEEEIGRVLGGDDAPALMDRIRQRCEELFTPTGLTRKSSDLDLCRERKTAAEKRVRDLETQVAEYRQKVEDLERLRAQRRQHDQEQTLVRAQVLLKEAQHERQRIGLLQRRVQDAQKEADLANAKFEAARETWRQRRLAIEAAKAAADAEKLLAEELASAQARAEPLRAQLADAKSALDAARVRHAAAKDAFNAAAIASRRARAHHELSIRKDALRKAEAAEAAAALAGAAADAILVDDAAVTALRERVATLGAASARLNAAETEVRFLPEAGRRIFDGDLQVSAGQPLRLAAETTLRLEGFGTIVIRPGAEDLRDRQQAASDAEGSLKRQLMALGIADPAAGEAAYKQRQVLLANAAAERCAVATYAPAGIEALREAIAAEEAELLGLSDAEAAPTLAVEAALAAVEAARIEQESATRELARGQEMWQERSRAWDDAERTIITFRVKHEEAVKHGETRQEALTSSRASKTDATLLSILKDEEGNFTTAGLLLSQARTALSGCDADAAASRLADAEARLAATQARLKRLTLQLRHLRRDGVEEPFHHLSVGTREQLAVLTRLAFAELLSERGQPAAVILDDALVYSDHARLARMQQVLLRAADRLQIIVLTCRPDDYAGLGVPVLRLADCSVANRPA